MDTNWSLWGCPMGLCMATRTVTQVHKLDKSLRDTYVTQFVNLIVGFYGPTLALHWLAEILYIITEGYHNGYSVTREVKTWPLF